MRTDLRSAPSFVQVGASKVPVSVEPDGRLTVVLFPADPGSYLWLTGRGDDPEAEPPERGTGTAIRLCFDDVARPTPETKYLDLKFLEQVELHDGRLFLPQPAQWDIDDEWWFSIYMHPTEATENPGGTGNCNIVGGYVVVPAAGDGTHDIDMDTAVPVPAADGYWDYDMNSNTLSASSTPGEASWHVLLVPVEWFFMNALPMPCHPTGVFDFDAYKAERVSPRWCLRLTVAKASDGAGDVAGWIVVFRQTCTRT